LRVVRDVGLKGEQQLLLLGDQRVLDFILVEGHRAAIDDDLDLGQKQRAIEARVQDDLGEIGPEVGDADLHPFAIEDDRDGDLELERGAGGSRSVG
jgi:hypothetical protein